LAGTDFFGRRIERRINVPQLTMVNIKTRAYTSSVLLGR